ncbi:MAG: response regulator [Gemmatimonadales bacterium]|nr:response regulator [Gemmatimonadales bacterium]NIN10805.1 response regulator [Gemmatimonadales bacterium]NIN49449.1 response regulator [Gemmatimonadales bacterium]NIP06913.1 response regulator [Gemmatimonadales bacterium]NIR02849.1 response regulator [Gemmatimonadales bacterium]
MDVLVIDDDPDSRASLQKVIEHAGYAVRSVDNGLAAFAEIQQRSYKAIVCDIVLPFMDGVGFYEQLQEDYPHLAKRVLFVTAWAEEPTVHRFLEQTERPFLPKPYDIGLLTTVLQEMVDEAA